MSEVQLVVREWNQDWSGAVHGSQADRAIAALSADPLTLEELELALGRFSKPNLGDRHDLGLEPGLRDHRHDAGRIVIDLAARLVAIDSDYSDPDREGVVYYHNGQYRTSHALPYRLADEWMFIHAFWDWRQQATDRRLRRSEPTPANLREILYGPCLLEFVARETHSSACRILPELTAPGAISRAAIGDLLHEPLMEDSDTVERGCADCRIDARHPAVSRAHLNEQAVEVLGGNPISREIRDLHARWLLSPRVELGGQTPRDALFSNRAHLERELHNRCESWSLTGLAPPPLPVNSEAFQNAGVGLHEAVMYHHLVRELLWSSWEHWSEALRGAPEALFPSCPPLPAEALHEETERLTHIRETWLETAGADSGHRTPRSVILNERRRMPEVLSPEERLIDPDCPCCQMLAEMPGPCFWHLDGTNLDDEFAFDVHEATFADWELSRSPWQEPTYQSGLGADRNETAGSIPRDSTSPNAAGTSLQEASAASTRMTAIASPPLPLGLATYLAALHVAELTSAIDATRTVQQTSLADERLKAHLNRHFGNLRALLPTPGQTSLPGIPGDSLLIPSLERLYETLAEISVAHSSLDPLCQKLAHELSRIVQVAVSGGSPAPDGPGGKRVDGT
jgi:hypothetical protein